MYIIKPIYFDSFRCIAGACPDSCCKEWDIRIDAEKAALYRNLPGVLGDDLRRVLKEEDGETVMALVDGRCPMWRSDGLCRIQSELGEHALCKTCRDFPRLTHDYGDFQEWTLELSCPEAARIILSAPHPNTIVQEIPGREDPEYDMQAMDILLRTRETLGKILANKNYAIHETLAIALLYGYHAQAALDGAPETDFDPDAALTEARSFAVPGNTQPMIDYFKGLEILSASWSERLAAPIPTQWEPAHLNLARYFADRYWLQAVSDYDLVSRVKLMIISCLLIKTLGGNLIETAQQYSKEIENDIDNVEAILDAAYTNPAFTDSKILGLLLM